VEPGAEQAGDLEHFPGGLGGRGAASHGAQEELVGTGPAAPAPLPPAVVDVQGDVAGPGEAGQADAELGQAHLLAAGEGGHVEGERPAGAVLQGAWNPRDAVRGPPAVPGWGRCHRLLPGHAPHRGSPRVGGKQPDPP